VSYLLTTRVLGHIHQISPEDQLVGGMWAMIATAFVYRLSYDDSITAAISRASATALSFVLCFTWLLFFSFSLWATALLIGIGSLVLMLVGRPEDVITATITTAVVMVLAAVDPRDTWEQPILRLADTLVGIGVGVAVSWLGLRLTKIERVRR
jgi:uncharacterized membrane protein YgaE (UPF0421/DUF939 family)